MGCEKAAAPEAAPSHQIARTFYTTTAHFQIASTADPLLTAQAGAAAESSLEAYRAFVGETVVPSPDRPRLQLRLYATRAELQANNRSRPWAEAYYVSGVSHAYLDIARPNPHHFLMHELVHQFNRELTGYAAGKWLNEGLATYIGGSRFVGGRLELGAPDRDTYPLWWLHRWPLSGDWDEDVREHRVVPLRALITGEGGPPLDATVNAHYLGYWSLTHFLLHHEGGRYAAGYHHLLRHGGTVVAFEQHIGPVAEIQGQWYGYLLKKVAEAKKARAALSPGPAPTPASRTPT